MGKKRRDRRKTKTPKAKALSKREIMDLTNYVPLPLYILRHRTLSPQLIVAFAEILSFYFKENSNCCWPCEETLAEHTGRSERTWRRWLAGLEAERLIAKKHRGNKSNVYYIITPPKATLDNPLLRKKDDSAGDSGGFRGQSPINA